LFDRGEPPRDEDEMTGIRERFFALSTRLYGPDPQISHLTWLGDERIAIGKLPTAATMRDLPSAGVTDIVNCRTLEQTWISQDLAIERAVFGPTHVVHAPMWDIGRWQKPRLWSTAALFAAKTLDANPGAGVLMHCQQGRRRSTMMAYAVMRLRGRTVDEATKIITDHRREAVLVPIYAESVEAWIAAGARPVGPLRMG
jgi:protein-tyrosine phosphatase